MKFFFLVLYDAAILLYRIGIQIASLRNLKARQWIEGRKNLFENIQSQLKENEFRVWFHCASAGEFEQGRPVIEAYHKRFPAHKIVLTFYSPSGYELQKNYFCADYIFYLPLDTATGAKKFISLVDPHLAVFVKYELWFHFLHELNQRKIPAIIISAIFREHHLLFNNLASPLRNEVKNLEKIFVQDEDSLSRLQTQSFMNPSFASDTRFDRVWEIAQSPKQLSLVQQFKSDKKLLVAGSTWREDEKFLLQLIRETNEWRLVIVPHEINSDHISQLKKNFPEAKLYSEIESGKSFSGERTLIVDKIGFLSSIYQYADLAYIGGGFGKGIHNTLEAAVFGIPVIFGPNYQKFNEAKKLIEIGGAKAVHNFTELLQTFEFYQREENKVFGIENKNWVQQQTGGTEKIIQYLGSIISDNGA